MKPGGYLSHQPAVVLELYERRLRRRMVAAWVILALMPLEITAWTITGLPGSKVVVTATFAALLWNAAKIARLLLAIDGLKGGRR